MNAESAPAVRFARLVRDITSAARAAGLAVPAFRTPPRRAGATRTIRRLPGGAVVAVAINGRPYGAVVADLIAGIVAMNGLTGTGAQAVETMLRRSLRSARVAERQTQAA